MYFDEVKEAVTSTLKLYGAPQIMSMTIPKAGTSYGGNKLPVTITGKNFTAPGISATSFTGIPALSDVQIVNDTLVKANVYCPYTAGETDLTVTCTPEGGSPAQGTGKIIVKDYSGYTLGKIVLKDENLVSKDDYTAIDESNPPVAIIAGLNGYGRAIGIALHIADLRWAKIDSTGYNTGFEGIICEPSVAGNGAASTATFTGDLDGSDNWDYICSIDPEGTKDAVVAENYPAFNWVNRYNTIYAAQLGGINFVWYMPSLAELCGVYRNREAINASLAKIYGLGSSYADSSLGTFAFWSSSQVSYPYELAWRVYFDNGNVYFQNKFDGFGVCCLTVF